MADTWTFATGFDPQRRERLLEIDNFATVVHLVTTSAKVGGGWICQATDLGYADCWRPVASITVSREAFDAFFNSPGGYRARFLESPETGQAANGQLLHLLEPRLSAAVIADCGPERLPPKSIKAAFLANSAKIWPDESQLDLVNATHDLAIERWTTGCDDVNAPQGAALWAPEGTELLAIGAFLDRSGNELVSRRKVLRRFELHDCGFT